MGKVYIPNIAHYFRPWDQVNMQSICSRPLKCSFISRRHFVKLELRASRYSIRILDNLFLSAFMDIRGRIKKLNSLPPNHVLCWPQSGDVGMSDSSVFSGVKTISSTHSGSRMQFFSPHAGTSGGRLGWLHFLVQRET